MFAKFGFLGMIVGLAAVIGACGGETELSEPRVVSLDEVHNCAYGESYNYCARDDISMGQINCEENNIGNVKRCKTDYCSVYVFGKFNSEAVCDVQCDESNLSHDFYYCRTDKDGNATEYTMICDKTPSKLPLITDYYYRVEAEYKCASGKCDELSERCAY